jgi:hypothetical protein
MKVKPIGFKSLNIRCFYLSILNKAVQSFLDELNRNDGAWC